MRHATDATLDVLEPLLQRLRTIDGLIERKRGIFYRKSVAFVHFHEDPAGLFADVRVGADWRRLPAKRPQDQEVILGAVREEIGVGDGTVGGAIARRGAPPATARTRRGR